jgi:hypothetical protein
MSSYLYGQISVSDMYDFPLKQGSIEWKSFETGQQMLEACQIPQKILDKISTTDLVKTCLSYPLFFEYLAFNNEREGIHIMIDKFNGLKELSKRQDGAQELIKIYNDFPVVQTVTSKDADIPYKLPFLELLIADDVFINQLTENELAELSKIILNKYESKLKYTDIYSIYNIKRTFLLGSVVLDKQNKSTKTQQNVIRNYIENYNNAESNLLTEISKIISQL